MSLSKINLVVCDSKRSLDWKKFLKLLDLLVANEVKQLNLIDANWDWEYLDTAIMLAQTLGMRVSVTSDFTKRGKAIPYSINANGNAIANPKSRIKILTHLAWYRRKGSKCKIHFNLKSKDSEKLLKQYIEWGKFYSDVVSFAIQTPYSLSSKNGKLLYRFAEIAVTENLPISLNQAIPLCVFTPQQRLFLLKHANLYGKSIPGITEFTINPNLTIFPENNLQLPEKLPQKFNQASKIYLPKILKLIAKPKWRKCKNCMFFSDICQGGNLATRVKK